jgi:serine/threonine-protein kinase RsbW
MTATCLHFVIPATPTAMVTVTGDVTQFLQREHWSEDEVGDIDLALQEALANGIRHGCKGDPTKRVACSITHEPSGELTIVVRDEGTGFDPAAVPSPLEADNLFKSSGRGVFLINTLMDEVAYADGGREVRMRKRRAPAVDRRVAA